MRRATLGALALSVGATAAGAAAAAAADPASQHQEMPFEMTVSPFPGLDEPRVSGCLALRAGLRLRSDRAGFGGYSDLSLEGPDGRATLISDAALLFYLRLHIDDAGDIVGASDPALMHMHERDDSVLGKRDGDAEGLAWTGNGFVVSFEGEHRVARMSGRGQIGDTLYPDAGLARPLGKNSGLEALTQLPDGRLLAMSEATGPEGEAIVLRGRMDQPLPTWERAAYRPAKGFAVTGADVDPLSGDLFVLERAFSIWRGARMRIVRVPTDRIGADVLRGREIGRMGFLEGIDNMEGIVAARTDDGALRLYAVSDDNFSAAQRTVLLTLGLAPGCEDGDAAQPPPRGDATAKQPVER